MKKTISILTLSILLSLSAFSQWCTPVVAPYLGCPSMPGISNVTFHTINYSSPTCESPTSNYLNTGVSATVIRGNTYPFSMTYNIDPGFDTLMNLRVWIDFDIDHAFAPSETVVSMNYQSPGTYTGSITIPGTATIGTTKMRVTSKMTSNGGHTLPTPCNYPADPLGYHGGVEDYTLVISAPTSIDEPMHNQFSMTVAPNPATEKSTLTYSLAKRSKVRAAIYNVEGREVTSLIPNESQAAGRHNLVFKTDALEHGLYFLHLSVGGINHTQKFVVLKE